ncbi:PA2169 family four-helix-bundle protein [Sporolactobacillus shoreicorticis]|uniref:DUF2383 domain-containing protein n=1 Tax=Sporolactobacillus shoreicorticis TaxID=1923877 RepID=A0ABW5S987_9BACL|nr:DUF2383 domain-containing protein [Sporolactobacillus shoreicorticis]MCO7127407.1 PA2169 family four-helix-bundle protein [Sporolactobacillus shoreicorticis]
MKNEELTALNGLLKGLYMGIHAYDHFMENAKNHDLKQTFQTIQHEIREQALRVVERIQNLGGTPIEDAGWIGAFQDYLVKLRVPHEDEQIIQKAIEGEQLGIEMTEKTVRGNLSAESERVVRELLNQDRTHVRQLKAMISQTA